MPFHTEQNEENTDSKTDSTVGLKNHLSEDKNSSSYKEHKPDKNPYSNKDLEKFISYVGFNVDEVPRFSEMAKKINLPIKHEEVKKDLTSLDNHDTIKDVTHLQKNGKDLEIRREALKRLMAKYRG